MATYYVAPAPTGSDAADGLTEATPWETIGKVNGETFAADDVVLFEGDGTWDEALIVPRSGMSFGVYGGAVDARAIIDVDGAESNCIACAFDDCSFTRINLTGATGDGFFANDASGLALSFMDSTVNGGDGFKLNGDDISILSLVSSGNTGQGYSQAGTYDGLTADGCSANDNVGDGWKLTGSTAMNVVSCVGSGNGNGSGSSRGLALLGCSGTGVFTRFFSDDNDGHGIQVTNNGGVHSNDLVFSAPVSRGNGVGATTGSGISIDQTSNNIVITGPTISGNDEAGIVCRTASNNITVAWGVIHDNPIGFWLTGNHGVNCRLFQSCVMNSSTAGAAITGSATATAGQIKCNIFRDNEVGLMLDAEGISVTHDINVNLYYNHTTAAVVFDEETYIDSAIDTFFGDHAYESGGIGGSDPTQAGPPSDVHLIPGSPAIAAGVTVATGVDYYGSTPKDPPSIGPSEHMGYPFWNPAYGGRRI
jgi:hypothetical protein